MEVSIKHNLIIRQESIGDIEKVFLLVKEAFEEEKYSDHKEQYLVERLRVSTHFVPELSLVAEVNKKIIGYILLTQAAINSGDKVCATLAMAPVAVCPDHQHQGVGAALINYAHKKAFDLGYESIVLIGHQYYYPKFGYRLAHEFGISFPFDVPDNNCFVIELKKGGLKAIHGTVKYAPEFYKN